MKNEIFRIILRRYKKISYLCRLEQTYIILQITMSNIKEKLFTEFTAPTTQEWLDKIEVDLKGADFQKRLVWRTNEGFNVQPFYRREDLANLKTPDALPGEFPFVRGNKTVRMSS